MCNMNGVGKAKIILFFWLKTRIYRCSLLCYNRLVLHSRNTLMGVGKGQLSFFFAKNKGLQMLVFMTENCSESVWIGRAWYLRHSDGIF